MTTLDDRMERSASAFSCRWCGQLIQFRLTHDKRPVVLEPYPSDDGEYVIDHTLHAVRSEGPFAYAKHKCEEA